MGSGRDLVTVGGVTLAGVGSDTKGWARGGAHALTVPKLSDENEAVEEARAAGRWAKISPSIAFAVSIPSLSGVVLPLLWGHERNE